MLVLGRKPTETILIGGTIRVTLVRCTGNGARIGIEAPPDVSIVRAELVEGSAGNPPGETEHPLRERLRDNSAANAQAAPSVARPTWPAPVSQ